MIGIINLLLAASGTCGGGSSLNATTVFAEGFGTTPVGGLPMGWLSLPGDYPWHVINGGNCGGVPIAGEGACTEAWWPSAISLNEELHTPPVGTPTLIPGQNVYLKYYYSVGWGSWSALDVFIKTYNGTTWSPPVLLASHISTVSPNLINITGQLTGSTQFKLIFRARFASREDSVGVEVTGAFLDSVIVFVADSSDTTDRGNDDRCDTCCNLVSSTGLVIDAPTSWPWFLPPISFNNYIELCNMGCYDSTDYTFMGRLYVNGNLVHSSTYTVPPGSCQTISWPYLTLKFGSNTASFVVTPLNDSCSSYRYNTGFYIHRRGVPIQLLRPYAVAGPVDLSGLFGTHPCEEFPSLCEVPGTDGIRAMWYRENVPDTLTYLQFEGVLLQIADTTLQEGDSVSGVILIFDPTSMDTIVQAPFRSAVYINELGVREIAVANLPLRGGSVRLGDVLPMVVEVQLERRVKPLATPVPRQKPVEIKQGTLWDDVRSFGVAGDVALYLLLGDPSITDVSERPSGNYTAASVDYREGVLYVEGEGELKLYSSDGRLVLRRTLKGRDAIPVSHLPEGVYFYTVGQIRGRFIKR